MHVEDPLGMANSFSSFSAIFVRDSSLWDDIKFNINKIEKDKVLKYLSTMDSCTATSIDHIGHRLLKYAAHI